MGVERKYDVLAVDLDGTLLDRKGRVSEGNRRAVRAAREAGIRVVVCTGRGLVECAHALEAIEQKERVVVAGGAIIACPVTRRTEHRFAVDPTLVARSVGAIHAHGHAALVLKDPIEAGYDYLVVRGAGGHGLDPVTAWWFEAMRCRVRYAEALAEDEHPEHTVRVGACGRSSAMARVEEDLARELADRAAIHHFPAVVAPESASADGEGGSLHVLEVFDKDANKWSAIRRLAAGWGVPHGRIAAIGDEINDLGMIAGAGLGVAMGNAVPRVRDAADRHTRANDDDGVAFAIERILAGEW